MSEFDLHSNIDSKFALSARTIFADETIPGNIIDTLGFESIEYILMTGTYTDGVYTLLLEEGDDAGLSDAAPVSSEDTLGILQSLIGTDQITRVGSIGKKRYQRASLVSTGVTSGSNIAVFAILGHSHTAPVPQ